MKPRSLQFFGLICLLLMFVIGSWSITQFWLQDQTIQGQHPWLLVPWLLIVVLLSLRFLFMLGLAAIDTFWDSPTPPSLHDHQPLVSLIMPVFNEGKSIKKALRSLVAQDYRNFEIIVVDDGSRDESFAHALVAAAEASGRMLAASAPQIRVLHKANGGKADALNHGLAHAHGEIVICVDGDSRLDKQAVSRLVRHFVDPRVGAVAGHVRIANDSSFWAALQGLEYLHGYGLFKRAQNAAHLVSVVPGPIGAFRKQAIAHIGGYSNKTFAEDFDLTLSLLGRGWHVKYEPTAYADTEAPESLLELVKQRYRWTRGTLQALRKRSYVLTSPKNRPLVAGGLAYLWIDSVAFPVLNVLSLGLFIYAGFLLQLHELMIAWWAQVLVLDVTVITFCVAMESTRLRQLWWILHYRLIYQNLLDVIRVLASIEEFLGLKMNWGAMKRLGKI